MSDRDRADGSPGPLIFRVPGGRPGRPIGAPARADPAVAPEALNPDLPIRLARRAAPKFRDGSVKFYRNRRLGSPRQSPAEAIESAADTTAACQKSEMERDSAGSRKYVAKTSLSFLLSLCVNTGCCCNPRRGAGQGSP